MPWFRLAGAFLALAGAFSYHGPGQPYFAALGVLAAILLVAHVEQRSDFAPITVHIRPLLPMLTETGLTTEDEWKVKVRKPRSGDHSFMRDGVRFTVLKPDNFDQSGLVYWHDFKVFTTAAKWTLPLKELARPHPSLDGFTVEPRLYLKPSADGLSLKLSSSQEEADADEWDEPGRELTVFPWAVSRGYGFWQNQKRTAKWRATLLAKYGWEKKLDDGSLLAHKYFVVDWDFI